MSTRTLPTTARQQPPAAVAAKSRRRFWANLVVQVSGLLAMLVVAVYSASAQAQDEARPTEIRLSLDPEMVPESRGLIGVIMVTAEFVGERTLDQNTTVTLSFPSNQGPSSDGLFFATDRVDYEVTRSMPSVIIPAGMLFATLSVRDIIRVVHDLVPEGDELVVVAGTAKGFTVIPTALRINDDDPVFIKFDQTEDSVLEGGVFRYSVGLQPYPSIDTEVTVEVVMGQDAVGNFGNENKRVLTFLGKEISDASATPLQLVEVRTLDNVDFGEPPQVVKLRHTVTDGDLAFVRGVPVQTVTLTITDSDQAGIEISKLNLELMEFGSEELGDANEDDYTVRLLSRPSGNVSVVIDIEGDDTLGTLIGDVINVFGLDDDAPLTLLFTESNWNVPQSVIVVTENNDIYTENQRVTITHTVSSEGDSNYETQARLQSRAETEVKVLVMDNDQMPTKIRLILEPNEGEENSIITFSIVPRWLPVAIIGETEVILRHHYEDDITSLLNDNVQDPKDEGEVADENEYSLLSGEESIVLTIPSGKASVAGTNIQLQINDDDTEEANEYIVFGGTAYIGDKRAESVSVLPAPFRINANDASRVQFTLEGMDIGASNRSYTLKEGKIFEYSVVLESKPIDNVTVTVIVSGDEGYGEEITILANDEVNLIGGGTLLFTRDNWDVPQTVMVEAADNDYYRGDLEVTLEHSTAGGGDAYNDLPVPTIVLNIEEQDDPPTGIQLSLDMEEWGEGSGTVAVQVTARLLGETTFGVETTVGLRINHINDTMEVGVPETLAVDGEDYYSDVGSAVIRIPRLGQVGMVDVSLEVLQNFIDEEDKILVFGGTVTTKPELDIASDVEVETAFLRITDDDERGLVFSPQTEELFVEEGRFGVYSLVLNSEPTGPVNVTLMVTQGDDALGSIIGVLTFSASGNDDKWDIPQNVSFRPVDNNYKNSDVPVTIRHTASGGRYGDQLEDYTLTIKDDETSSTNVSVKVTSGGDVNEDGNPQSVELTVRLNEDPFDVQTPVNLSIAPASSSAISGIDFSSARITSGVISGFDDLVGGVVTVAMPPETSTTKVVLVLTPVFDDIDEGDFETIEIIASVAGLASAERATIRIKDDDDAGISLSKPMLQVAEGGDAVTYSVELDTKPLGNVLVSLDVNGPSNNIITRAPEVLTFTPENWNVPRTVEVLAGMDDTRNDIRQLTITHTAVGGTDVNDGYSDPLIETLELKLIDPSVLISPQSDTVTEGESTMYDVRLTSVPTLPVTVMVTIFEGASEIGPLQLNVAGVEQPLDDDEEVTLSFDNSNWKAYQTVTIQTLGNGYSGTNPRVVIEHTVSSDGDYENVIAESFTLTITDDEVAATSVELSLDPLDVDENDEAGLAVVTLTATLAGLPRNEMTTMTLRINDPNLPSDALEGDLAMEDVDFTLRDPTTSTFELTIPAFQQSAMIELLFDLVDDDLDEGDSEIIVISGEAGTLAVDPATLEINDDDSRGVTVMPTELFVAEEADAVIYTVVLTSEPAGDEQVTVELSVIYASVEDEITQDEVLFDGKPGSLTLFFGGTGSDNPWNEPQEVSVTLMVNADIDGARDATLTHSVSGADYNGVTVENVPMALTDYGVVVSEGAFAVLEGERYTYTLSLTSAPTGNVTVEILIPPPYSGVLSAELTTYTFDGGNWSDRQDVIVTLEDDELFNEERVLIIEHRVSLSEDPNYEDLAGPGIRVTLEDNEEQPILQLDLSQDSSEEGSGEDNTIVDVVATVSLEGALRSEDTMGTLSFEGVSDDTATVGEDYTGQVIAFIIPAGKESVEVSFELGLIADQIDEGESQFFTITASDDLSNVASVLFTIDDDDEAGVRVTLEDRSVREGDEIRYTVVLESDPAAEVTVLVTVERVLEPVSEARPENVSVNGALTTTLRFNSDNWFMAQGIHLTVEDPLTLFGELEIRHTAEGVSTYAALPPVSAVLELTDVDVDLSALQVMTAAGETTLLFDSAGVEIQFSADVTDYFAAVPFPDRNASITATPSVIEDRPDEQEKGRVRIFRENDEGTLEALEGGADVASTATEVNLPEGDTFAFLIEVSARPLPPAAGEEIARQTYTLTLRRALPASAELQVYLDADRETPITALDFGPDDDEMDLILILRGDGEIRYSISGIDISGLVNGFALPVVGDEINTGVADFETPVTLSRADDVEEDVSYSLLFTATPERPMADVNPLSATIEGTLKASTDTETEIQATYRSHSQEEELPISSGDEITVSDNGPVTITLVVEYLSGGDRTFEQSSFTFAVTGGLGEIQPGSNILEIQSDEVGQVTVRATGEGSLNRINSPVELLFEFSFESPQAVIRAVANADPLLAFSDPFFAFVDEDRRLPLEVVLADGSTPLANSVDILGGLALELLLEVEDGEIPKTVTIAAGGDSTLPGRDLTFAINAARNSVTVEVAVDGAGSDYVKVDNLVFTAHFLSLRHDEDIDFLQGPDVQFSELSLSGEDSNNDSWSFRVANEVELADDQYEVIEVILAEAEKMISVMITKTVTTVDEVETTSYTVVTQTVQIVAGVEEAVELGEEATELDEAEALSTYEKYPEFAEFAADAERTAITILVDTIEAIYMPLVGESEIGLAAEERVLQVTRLHPDAEDSRIVLEFEYFLDNRSAGVFTRAIDLINGVPSNLKVEVIPSVLVVAKGGAPGQVQLVISNLDLEDDPSAPEASIDFRVDPDLVVEPQGIGEIDRINSRFEQTLNVTAAAAADREKYTVVVEVLLPGKRLVTAEFTVDINDAPQYVGENELTVYESGDNKEAEYRLQIVDSDGGLQFLNADELSLEVIGFGYTSRVVEVDGDYNNGYFELAFSEISRVGQEEEGSANGKPNSLTWTLTLTGVLATPFNSVVQLRLFGVTDGFDDFEQYLTVQVKNRPPQFELAETQAIAVFLEREPVSVAVTAFDGVTDVVVLEAPDDLVVKYDETERAITLRRLNIDPANDAEDERAGSDVDVKLAALDAQGGRKVVTITVARPPLLPQIMQPNPLLIAAGQSGTRLLELVKGTALDVDWTVVGDSSFIDTHEFDADGHRAELSLTIAVGVEAGQEFELLVAAAGGGYHRTARLPVVVVAEAAKPHLKLRATVPDSADPTKAAIVSSFALTEALSIGVALEGEVPSSEKLGTTTPNFRIRIVKLDDSGEPITAEGTFLVLMAASEVDGSELEIPSVLVGEQTTTLALAVGDVVEVSIEHLLQNGEVSDEIIVGDSLRLRVSEGPGRVDADNDGLADSSEGGDGPAVLGPITAAVARVTDSGVESQGDDIEVSLSLGETSRFLGLGECGGVSLTLTLSEDGGASLSGCSDGAEIELSQLLETNTLMALELEENGAYQLIDISATFDSSEADPGGPLVISLPVDPQQPHVVYRFDEEGKRWVQVLGAGLPGQPELGGQGALDDLERDCASCFYALDFDRDGSVQLLLLLVPIDPVLGLEFALENASLEGRQLEIGAEKSEIITLLGFEGLTVRITGAAIDGGNVDSSVSVDDSTVELFGLKRTRNGPEEVLVEALDESGSAVATITLYVRVPNQPPKITFEHEDRDELRLQLPSGEFMTTPTLDLTEVEGVLALAPNTETVLLVIIEDAADGDEGFELVLTPEDGMGVANLVSRVMRTTDDLGGVVDVIVHRLTLESTDARAPFKLTLTATDPSDRSSTPIELTVCVSNSEGQCPAAAPRRSRGGGGGGGTGLLWLLFAAPAALCRATRLRQRLAARARRATP